MTLLTLLPSLILKSQPIEPKRETKSKRNFSTVLIKFFFLKDKPLWKEDILFGSIVPVQLYMAALFWGIILVFLEKRHLYFLPEGLEDVH